MTATQSSSTDSEIRQIESQIYELNGKLEQLRKLAEPVEVKNYMFETPSGSVSLSDLFGERDRLIAIHNMGQGCRYCTLWADGFNGFLPHLESVVSVVLLSKDTPSQQRTFANSRQWRFRMASHSGGDYIREQSVVPGETNVPGVVCYERKDGRIFKKNTSVFGPGDLFCPQWSLLSLAGVGVSDWTPQFNYWSRPVKLDDGGQGLIEPSL